MKGTKDALLEAAPLGPVAPDVRFAPFGCGCVVNVQVTNVKVGEEEGGRGGDKEGARSKQKKEHIKENTLTPIGRELSVNWHDASLQTHLFPIGSQNGVLQFAGTGKRCGCPATLCCGGLGFEGASCCVGQPYYNSHDIRESCMRIIIGDARRCTTGSR